MRMRVLPLLLAVLILTNPVCCQMLGSDVDMRSEEPVETCAGCACEREPCEPSNDDEGVPQAPCECPNCDLCQCVCAGAVVTDIVTVDDIDGETPIDLIAEPAIDLVSSSRHGTGTCDVRMACGATNVGRAARILHSSLLC